MKKVVANALIAVALNVINMNFKLEAANFFLSDNVEEGLEIIEKEVDEGKGSFSYGGVDFSIWEPFENYSMSDILSYIEDLESKFTNLYNRGKYEKSRQV